MSSNYIEDLGPVEGLGPAGVEDLGPIEDLGPALPQQFQGPTANTLRAGQFEMQRRRADELAALAEAPTPEPPATGIAGSYQGAGRAISKFLQPLQEDIANSLGNPAVRAAAADTANPAPVRAVAGGLAGLGNAASSFVTPDNAAIGGALAIPSAHPVIALAKKAISLYFADQMARDAMDQIPGLGQAIADRDYGKIGELGVQVLASLGMAGGAATHGVDAKGFDKAMSRVETDASGKRTGWIVDSEGGKVQDKYEQWQDAPRVARQMVERPLEERLQGPPAPPPAQRLGLVETPPMQVEDLGPLPAPRPEPKLLTAGEPSGLVTPEGETVPPQDMVPPAPEAPPVDARGRGKRRAKLDAQLAELDQRAQRFAPTPEEAAQAYAEATAGEGVPKTEPFIPMAERRARQAEANAAFEGGPEWTPETAEAAAGVDFSKPMRGEEAVATPERMAQTKAVEDRLAGIDVPDELRADVEAANAYLNRSKRERMLGDETGSLKRQRRRAKDELEHDPSEYEDDRVSEGVPIEEQFAAVYADSLRPEGTRRFNSKEDMLSNLRSVLDEAQQGGMTPSGLRTDISDAELLAGARDAYEYRKRQIERMRAGGHGMTKEQIAERLRSGVRRLGDETGSITHREKGKPDRELDTPIEHIKTLGALIYFNGKTEFKPWEREMRRRFGRNVFIATDHKGTRAVDPTRIFAQAPDIVEKARRLTLKPGGRGDLTGRKQIRKMTVDGLPQKDWYLDEYEKTLRGMHDDPEIARERFLQQADFQAAASPQLSVPESQKRTLDLIRAAATGGPTPGGLVHEGGIDAAFRNERPPGPKVHPYGKNQRAPVTGEWADRTVGDRHQFQGSGFSPDEKSEGARRWNDAQMRIEQQDLDLDRLDQAQASFWSGKIFGERGELGNSYHKDLNALVESRGGWKALYDASDPNLPINRITELHNANGGFTWDVGKLPDANGHGGRAPGPVTDGYPYVPKDVTGESRSQTIPGANVTPEQIRDFINRNRDILRDERTRVGGWVDKDTGDTTLDIVYVAPTEAAALADLKPGEKAIFSLKDLADIPVDWVDGRAVVRETDGFDFGETEVRHRSPLADLSELDPEFEGTGPVQGAERRRGDWEPKPKRVFVQQEGTPFEHLLEGKGYYEYKGKIPTEKLYDLEADPKGYATREYPGNDTFLTKMERQMIADGYLGYKNKSGAIAWFDKIKVDLVDKAMTKFREILGDETGSVTRRNKEWPTDEKGRPVSRWAIRGKIPYVLQGRGAPDAPRSWYLAEARRLIEQLDAGKMTGLKDLGVKRTRQQLEGFITGSKYFGDETGSLLRKKSQLGAEGKENFDDRAAMLGRLGRSNFRQLEKADPELARKWRRVPTAYHGGRDFASAMSMVAQKHGIKYTDWAKVEVESRLVGAQQRWGRLLSDVQKMAPDQVLADFTGGGPRSMVHVLEAINDTNAGKVMKFLGDANDAAQKGDAPKLKQILEAAFDKARQDSHRQMTDAEFAKASADPKFKQVHDVYKTTIEPLLNAAHQANYGQRSPDLGPLDTFFPLSGAEPKQMTRKLVMRSSNAPQNPWDRFTTGLSQDYDLTPGALAKNVGQALRANALADAKISARAKGLTAQAKKVNPSTFRYKGESYRADLAGSEIMPHWYKKEIAPLVGGEHATWSGEKAQAVRDIVNTIAMVGPFDFVYHSANVAGTAHRVPAGYFRTPMANALSRIPIVGKIPALLYDALSERVSSKSYASTIAKLRNEGLIHDAYGSSTFSKAIAENTGIDYVNPANPWKLAKGGFGTLLHGPGGLDGRARVVFYRVAEKMGMTPEERYHFVNNLGNYVYQLNGSMARAIKKSGLSPFYTAGSTMGWNGAIQLLGAEKLPASLTPMQRKAVRLSQQINSGIIGAVAVWALHYKQTTGKYPWEDPDHMKLFKVPTGKNADGSTRYTSIVNLFAPGLSRGASAIGLRGALETKARGGTTGQAIDEGVKDIANTALHPVSGPIPTGILRFGLGVEPSIQSMRDERGRPRPQLRGMMEKAKPGVPSLGARTLYGLEGVNPLIEDVHDTVAPSPKQKTKKTKTEAAQEFFPPRLFTRGRPEDEKKRLRRQK